MNYIQEPKITWTYLSHYEGDKAVYFRVMLTMGEALTSNNIDLREQAIKYLEHITKEVKPNE